MTVRSRLRRISSRTGSADGEVKKGGGVIRGTGVSRDAEFGIAAEREDLGKIVGMTGTTLDLNGGFFMP